ncbi:Bro-N domain-containing protein [Streptomyces sp. NPDC047028]|uniref:BRO-N domain-containing protein n=1 Tax=Streptomyces sp. NPDC047028 TaxID=3155793 RepID=UPI0033CD0968
MLDVRAEQHAVGRSDGTDAGRDRHQRLRFRGHGRAGAEAALPGGEHWFPAADVALQLGYANTRQALLWHVAPDCTKRLSEIAQGVCPLDALRKLAGHRLQKSLKMVNLQGLIALVNGCTKPECEPFKAWVCEVISTLQRDGSYALEPAPVQPAPTGGTAYLMPQQVADAIVRLEERNIRADEALAVAQGARAEEMRRTNDVLGRIADTLDIIADRLQPPDPRPRSGPAEHPTITPQQLLATWKSRNLVVTDDVHAVAAYLAPALVRGPARCRLEDVASRTGLTLDRVHDCVRMLIKRGCMRQVGSEGDGVPVYVLP